MIRNQLPVPRMMRMGRLFDQNIFSIPWYQRNYSWGDNEVEDLIHDVLQVVTGAEREHFFGCLVTYSPTKNSQMVIDGQQRITTSLLLLAVIRDLAKKLLNRLPSSIKESRDDENLRYRLENIYFSSNTLLFGTPDYTEDSSLTLQIKKSLDNETDKQNYKRYFDGLITKDGTASKYEDATYRPIKLLRMVHRKIISKLTNLLNKYSQLTKKINTLFKIYTSFTHEFYVVLVEAPNSTDALTIYMTLNDRGKDLTTADIVKGQLAGVLENDKSHAVIAMNDWNIMSKSMQSNAKIISKFIKEYWEARYSYESSGDLARSILQKIETPNDATNMAHDLMELAPVYNTLTNVSVKSVFQSTNINITIKVLKKMGLVQYYPVILAMYHKRYDEKSIKLVINDIERIAMRHLLHHKSHTTYGNESHIIWNNNLSTNQIINDLNKQLDNDVKTFSAGMSYQHKYARSGKGINTLIYMIARIYAYENGDFNHGKDIYKNIFGETKFTVIRLSHKNKNNNLNAVGNWTILEKPLCIQANKDRDIGNLYNALSKSSLISNKKLARLLMNYSNNLNKLIIKRQNHFANDYVRVW